MPPDDINGRHLRLFRVCTQWNINMTWPVSRFIVKHHIDSVFICKLINIGIHDTKKAIANILSTLYYQLTFIISGPPGFLNFTDYFGLLRIY